MKSYRFSLGKEIGLCFTIRADSEEDAVKQANEFLAEEIENGVDVHVLDDSADVRLYFNPGGSGVPFVTASDIADIEEDDNHVDNQTV